MLKSLTKSLCQKLIIGWKCFFTKIKLKLMLFKFSAFLNFKISLKAKLKI